MGFFFAPTLWYYASKLLSTLQYPDSSKALSCLYATTNREGDIGNVEVQVTTWKDICKGRTLEKRIDICTSVAIMLSK